MPEIIEKDKLTMRVHVGDAADDDGNDYELSTTMSSAPMVRSVTTGRIFALTWHDILDMAIQAGVNEEPDGT